MSDKNMEKYLKSIKQIDGEIEKYKCARDAALAAANLSAENYKQQERGEHQEIHRVELNVNMEKYDEMSKKLHDAYDRKHSLIKERIKSI